MARYDFQQIEAKWQARWAARNPMQVDAIPSTKPKYYVLDMFPYPSGAGLHVGHPLGYIATDIVARYRRQLGYNVLHPMGYDAFGLPAEQYAIQTGIHPAETTDTNIRRYQEQLHRLGIGHDPDSETVRTCDPAYYRWTQWIFSRLFESWYDQTLDKARPIAELEAHFRLHGTEGIAVASTGLPEFSAAYWNGLDREDQLNLLQCVRLAYQAEITVNWCEALGTVLANEEVKDGFSERGGHPVVRKPMKQWSLRITAYAERLLRDLDTLEWPQAIKDQQTHWIGKSTGALIRFWSQPTGQQNAPLSIEVFSTRPDTVFGCSFLVLAPEHPLVDSLVSPEQQEAVAAYRRQLAGQSDRDRQINKTVSGVPLGCQAVHPFTGEPLPIWISDYVLMGYGTGAIMAVPAHDDRDHAFASRFGLPIRQVVAGPEPVDVATEAYVAKDGTLMDSDFLTGLNVPEAIERAVVELESRGLGARRTQYRLRDATFSRQRYWGEPFPIVYRNGQPETLPDTELPVTLPTVASYAPTGSGQSPLATATDWVHRPDGTVRETDTMPGWAGSSWYFFRYVDPFNDQQFADPEKVRYWLPVDLYIGGSEHAVGHLLYCRFWTKFLYDLGYVPVQEPVRKLVNQGMILGVSALAYKRKDSPVFVSFDQIPGTELDQYIPVHASVQFVQDDVLDVAAFRTWMPAYADARFELNPAGQFKTRPLVEKMSKSFHNVVNPDDLCAQYGTDCFRLFEMFLGPLEQSKPFMTSGINGVASFLRKLYNLYYSDTQAWQVSEDEPTERELKTLHQTLKKVSEDIERLSFNTCIPQFMTCVNTLTELGCHKRGILEPLAQALAPFAPHLGEELWEAFGHTGSVFLSGFPAYNPAYLVESSVEYPIQINGKLRAQLVAPANATPAEVEALALAHETTQKWAEGRAPKKVIVVPGKIINIVF